MISQYDSLKQRVQGNVAHDEVSRYVYSTDASIYRVLPESILQPKNRSDIQAAMQYAAEQNLSLIPRGAATGTTGGCLGRGLILDTSRYMHHILEINYEKEYAIVEPGVVQDHLNDALKSKGYRLGPDTSTGNRATLGGMLANNAAGTHSMRYGSMKDHILEVELVLTNGETVILGSLSAADWREAALQENSLGDIIRFCETLREMDSTLFERAFPPLARRVSGYNLPSVLGEFPVNLAAMIAGSEGTLGCISRMKVKIVKRPEHQGLLITAFASMQEAFDNLSWFVQQEILALEMMDQSILRAGARAPYLKGPLNWLSNNPQMLFLVEIEGADIFDVKTGLARLQKEIELRMKPLSLQSFVNAEQMQEVWDLRKAGLGLLGSRRSPERPIAFLEDISVRPEDLGSFLSRFREILQAAGKEASFFGHAGAGCVHVRPRLNLDLKTDQETMVAIMQQVTPLVREYQGALSGEHGDGLIRSWLNPQLFGSEIYEQFVALKKVFDPDNRMNPGKVVSRERPLDHLKTSAHAQITPPETFLNFSRDGGFSFALDMCNGNGACRKPKGGTMCPSFQGSLEEDLSTRGRVNGLLWALHKGMDGVSLDDPILSRLMDLCLQCKACKKECPSQVDMAKLKSEYLWQRYQKNGIPWKVRFIGGLPDLYQVSSWIPHLFNLCSQSGLGRWFSEKLDIAPERALPSLAPKRGSKLCKELKNKVSPSLDEKPDLILLPDTFTEFVEPENGLAALHLIHHQKKTCKVPPYLCCGRPALSKGYLSKARKQASKLVNALYPYAKEGIPISCLEPGCLYTIRNDYPDLIPGPKTEAVAAACQNIESFLMFYWQKNGFPKAGGKECWHIHGHCFEKAANRENDWIQLLNSFSELSIHSIPSGCCGMAGSFGYEKDHYDLSMKIGENQLFPYIKRAPKGDQILTSGFSCRTQVKHGTGRTPWHPVNALAKWLGLS